jgi:hypothetical protein
MTEPVRSLADLMVAAAAALAARDHAAVEHLMSVNEGWLQSAHEADATRALLEAIWTAVDDLSLHEQDDAIRLSEALA